MVQMIKRFLKKEKGVAAIEFSLTVFIFATVVVAFFDLAFLCVASAELDYIVATSTKYSKNYVIQGKVYPEQEFKIYADNATKAAKSLVSQIIGNDSMLAVAGAGQDGSRVQVQFCPARDFQAIIAQLQSLATSPPSKSSCKNLFTPTSYYPYGVYQYRINYKPFISFLPEFGRYTQQLLTRRYVSLQEWVKTPASEFNTYNK